MDRIVSGDWVGKHTPEFMPWCSRSTTCIILQTTHSSTLDPKNSVSRVRRHVRSAANVNDGDDDAKISTTSLTHSRATGAAVEEPLSGYI
jgi:hypothetical protein